MLVVIRFYHRQGLTAGSRNQLLWTTVAIELAESLADPFNAVAFVQMADGHTARQLGHHELNLLILFLQQLLQIVVGLLGGLDREQLIVLDGRKRD
ncbi:hypothetical protein SDC9_212014 [bioreactor metagenome]|uniref:Uncharacterized protein n=1 Tax=bioreactor metagenome TaxID=1076179 RepID=A0A645JYW5_9ZZZZ